MIKTNRAIGSFFILMGTAIGAGMLALPLVGAATGLWHSIVVLIAIWAVMTLTALMILEVNLAFKPNHNSFSTMSEATLGFSGKVVTWIAYLMVLYTATVAYIAGSTSLLQEILTNVFHLKSYAWLNALGFTLVFGGAVFWSTRAVDYAVRFLLSAKGILLLLTLILLLPHVQIQNLVHKSNTFKYIWVAAPIFLNAFGIHFVIPSVSSYCGPRPKILQWVIILALTIPLLIYIIWLYISFGIVPRTGAVSFANIIHEGTSVGGFVGAITTIIHNKYITLFVNGFTNIAMTTSFLGVSLSLFDFLADGCNRSNSVWGRLQTAGLTFIPPLVFAILYPQGFVIALEYLIIFGVVLEFILPALMVYKLRRSKTLHSPYKVPLPANFLLIMLTIISIFLVVIVIGDRLHLLPVF